MSKKVETKHAVICAKAAVSKKVETKHAVICAKAETARLEHLIDGHWKPAVERLEAQVVRLTEERNAALSALADYERLDRVESAEELEALPEGTILRDREGDAWQKDDDGQLMCAGIRATDDAWRESYLPMTVLWLPEVSS